jgi:hypothetical protein
LCICIFVGEALATYKAAPTITSFIQVYLVTVHKVF